MEEVSSSKRLAKNTIYLYLRQLSSLCISLFTIRVLLKTLGADDYGIFNVVGGIVTLFGFLSSTMATSTQRFLSFELGKRQNGRLNKVFSISINIYLLISLVIFLLSETIGLWFVNVKMVIPSERLLAANIVYQSTILSFLATIICTPYNASILSNEDMSVYAYLGISETVLKLLIVILLDVCSFFDNLIAYAILLLLITLLVRGITVLYCKTKYSFCKYNRDSDVRLFKSMLSFAGWNIIGSISNVLRDQGINVLINLFFGPVVNAARGIAYQINSAITSFSDSFYSAVRPQITKNYAANDSVQMENLICVSSRFSFYLLLVLMIPISLNADSILSLWLYDVPEYTNVFLQLVLLNALLEVYSMPLVTGIQATGKIRTYQLVVSLLYLLNLPISYVLLLLGFSPQSTVVVSILIVVVSIVPRIFLAHKSFNLNIRDYLVTVLLRTILVGVVCYLICYYLDTIMSFDSSLVGVFLSCIMMFIVISVIVFLFGVSKIERQKIVRFCKAKIYRNNI